MGKYKEKEKAAGPRARNDAYVMMLFITFAAIVAGCVLMYLDFEQYGSVTPPGEKLPAVPKLGEGPAPTGGGGGGGADKGGEPKGGGDTTPKGDTKMP